MSVFVQMNDLAHMNDVRQVGTDSRGREAVTAAVQEPIATNDDYGSLYVDWGKSAPSWSAIIGGGVIPAVVALIVVSAIVGIGLQFVVRLFVP